MKNTRIHRLKVFSIITSLIIGHMALLAPLQASANGLMFTVNVNTDEVDASPGDGSCETAYSGQCTLRAAIEEANANGNPLDQDTIGFSIGGSADFTVGGQAGHTIRIQRGLPEITQSVAIRASSQPGFSANTVVSPLPFNGKHVVEIDANDMPHFNNGGGERCFTITDTNEVLIADLVINHCANDAIAIQSSSNVSIQGNYIGVDVDGTTRQANGRNVAGHVSGLGIFAQNTTGLLIGGTNPADRNVVSGNQYGDILVDSAYRGSDPNRALDNHETTIQGNYTGLGADGTSVLPSGYAKGAGNSILMTNSEDDLIGGTATGATNVIASSVEYGISYRGGSRNGTIQGNFLGTDYTGNAVAVQPDGSTDCDPNPLNPCGAVGNASAAISIATISNNGLGFHQASHDFLIGGDSVAARNVVGGSSYYDPTNNAAGIVIHDAAYNVDVQGNYIGLGADGASDIGNQGAGIGVGNSETPSVGPVYGITIGGTTASKSNTITNNGSQGVVVGDDSTVSILQNAIYNNGSLGIDLNFDDITPNDVLDVDSGPNDFLNFPTYSSVVESAGDTTVDYSLDVPAGNYRIEFFSNTAADPSGNGEGETYLGATNVVSAGTGSQEYSYTLVGVTGVTNLAMTTTEIVGQGFGASSEFGGLQPPLTDLAITKTLDNPLDVAVGATLHYTITVTNNGYTPIDLTTLDGTNPNPIAGNLFIDYLPPELTYVSSSNPDITCTNTGTILSAALAAQHADWNSIWCAYTGGAQSLMTGQSISTTLDVTVGGSSDLTFTNYAMAPAIDIDPDTPALGAAFGDSYGGGGTPDFIDTMTANPNNNFTAAAYAPPAPNQATTIELANTGAPESAPVLIGFGLIVLAALGFISRRQIRARQLL